MTIKEMVSTYAIKLHGEDNLEIKFPVGSDKGEVVELLKANKPEIIAYLQAEKAAEEDCEAKIAAIEGLEELQLAYYAQADHIDEMSARHEDETLSSIGVEAPVNNIAALKAKYPRAAAYILAEDYSFAANDAKAAAGREALEEIIEGADPAEAIANMERAWSDYCAANID